MAWLNACCKNFETRSKEVGVPTPAELTWVLELSKEMGEHVKKLLPLHITVLDVDRPAFLLPDGDSQHRTHYVRTHNVEIPPGAPTLARHAQVLATCFIELIEKLHPSNKPTTCYVYTLLTPCGQLDYDGRPNRRHMSTRIAVVGE